jgi:hypothetical protein
MDNFGPLAKRRYHYGRELHDPEIVTLTPQNPQVELVVATAAAFRLLVTSDEYSLVGSRLPN